MRARIPVPHASGAGYTPDGTRALVLAALLEACRSRTWAQGATTMSLSLATRQQRRRRSIPGGNQRELVASLGGRDGARHPRTTCDARSQLLRTLEGESICGVYIHTPNAGGWTGPPVDVAHRRHLAGAPQPPRISGRPQGGMGGCTPTTTLTINSYVFCICTRTGGHRASTLPQKEPLPPPLTGRGPGPSPLPGGGWGHLPMRLPTPKHSLTASLRYPCSSRRGFAQSAGPQQTLASRHLRGG